jgi:hypothetical protein
VQDVRVSATAVDSVEVSSIPAVDELYGLITTSAEAEYDPAVIAPASVVFEGSPGTAVAGIISVAGGTFVDIWVSPFVVDEKPDWVVTHFDIDVTYTSVEIDHARVNRPDAVLMSAYAKNAILPDGMPSCSPILNSQQYESEGYVIITSEELADSFQPLRHWKAQLGYDASIITTEYIYTNYPGIDHPEQIRNYLTDAFEDGVRWVLFGGDETVIPIRYASHLDTDETPDLEQLQICDLYYADLTGEWDTDGDGAYGEPTHDNPDLIPELYLGRLLVGDATEAAMVVAKSLAYEKDPGDGESGFSTRVITASSDHMRDYHIVGQDYLVAEQLPEHIDVDIVSLAENLTGSDEAPVSPHAQDFVSVSSQGYNLTYVFAHGMVDGFVSKSSGYNNWPKSYVFTRESAPDGHGTLADMTNYDKFGVVYSIGCNNGAFDMDSPPFENSYPCVAEKLLTDSLSGAVAFVGHSRWGWVASSYKLAIEFNNCIFGADNRIAVANDFSRAGYHYLRDLVYGLNVCGDPALRIWTDTPSELSMSTPGSLDAGENTFTATISSAGQAVESAIVTVISNGDVLFHGLTGPDGTIDIMFDLDAGSSVILTASKPGYLPVESEMAESTPLDADSDDDGGILPSAYRLEQNYPNPFNPTTTIAFTIPQSSGVDIEVFNLTAQLVFSTGVRHLRAGNHEVAIDASAWPSGIYFYRIRAGGFTDIKKMVLLK